jgi:hypothetical protein
MIIIFIILMKLRKKINIKRCNNISIIMMIIIIQKMINKTKKKIKYITFHQEEVKHHL